MAGHRFTPAGLTAGKLLAYYRNVESWPHAPCRLPGAAGAVMVTGATIDKQHLLDSDSKLDYHTSLLLGTSREYGLEMQAWAVFANHYHFVGLAQNPVNLTRLVSKVHTLSARECNRLDDASGRRVWFQFWDTNLTFEKSYLARLNYVHENAVHHGLVQQSRDYKWCSAAWFEQRGEPAFVETVKSFAIDRLSVEDDY